MNRIIKALIALLFAGIVVACATVPAEYSEEPTPVVVEEKPEIEPEEPVEESSEVVEPEETEPVEEPFVVDEEVYEKAFTEIEQLIFALNSIISSGKFEEWKEYLTNEYIADKEDPANLKKISESPIMQKQGIQLRTLRDYFTYVVMPSRSNARLDDLEFVSDQLVKAYMLISDSKILLYNLEFIENDWKITQ